MNRKRERAREGARIPHASVLRREGASERRTKGKAGVMRGKTDWKLQGMEGGSGAIGRGKE
eukprot:1663059-Pleurochrysis_carterae.AAC.1